MARRQRRNAFSTEAYLKVKKKKENEVIETQQAREGKKGRDGRRWGRENLSFKSEAGEQSPCLLSSFNTYSLTLLHLYTSFPLYFPLFLSSPLPLPPRPPPRWLDGSLNGHSIPIREHSGSSLGCRVLNGGGNGYIRRLRRALHRR